MGGVAVNVSLLLSWLQWAGVQRRLKKLRERELVLPPDGVFLGGAPRLSLTRQHQKLNVLPKVGRKRLLPNLRSKHYPGEEEECPNDACMHDFCLEEKLIYTCL